MKMLSNLRDKILGVGYDDFIDEEMDDEDFIDSEYDDEYERPGAKRDPRSIVEGFSGRTRERDFREQPDRYERGRTRAQAPKPPRLEKPGKVLNMPTAGYGIDGGTHVSICNPLALDDATAVSDLLRRQHICVVNMTGLERANSQRIADFISGTSHALGCEIERITNDIFVIVPEGVHLSSSMREEIRSSGGVLSWIKAK